MRSVLVGFLGLVVTAAWGQSLKDVEWPTHGADLAATRYRPLDQINASNFNKLEVAWRFETDSLGNRPEYKLEGTPLMVNPVVYATAAHGDTPDIVRNHPTLKGLNIPRTGQQGGVV